MPSLNNSCFAYPLPIVKYFAVLYLLLFVPNLQNLMKSLKKYRLRTVHYLLYYLLFHTYILVLPVFYHNISRAY